MSVIKGFAGLMYSRIGAVVTAAFTWLKEDWALNIQLRHIRKIPGQMKESQEALDCENAPGAAHCPVRDVEIRALTER